MKLKRKTTIIIIVCLLPECVSSPSPSPPSPRHPLFLQQDSASLLAWVQGHGVRGRRVPALLVHVAQHEGRARDRAVATSPSRSQEPLLWGGRERLATGRACPPGGGQGLLPMPGKV